ncbi:Cytochrome P450 [Quillaja saponaria]|nr:Cytochrome P450 [Quillaja saponaria]
MSSQGIKGPSYRFIQGNAKEILDKRTVARRRPMDLSNDIFSKVEPHIFDWMNSYGRNFLQWYGPQAVLVVTEPELIKEIMNNKDRAYPKNKAQGYIKKLLGDGLVTSEGEKWAKMRKLANYTLHGESLKSMNPAMIASVEMMLARWKQYEGKEIEVYEEFRLLTAEVISRTAFGCSYLEGQNIFEMLMKLTLLISTSSLKIRFPGISKIFKTNDEIESEKLEKGIYAAITQMIKKREEYVKAGEVDSFGSDFLGLLVKAHHDADMKISIEDMVDECKTLYIAGQETTNSLLGWTVFLLAVNTEWQEAARKEVVQLFGKEDPKTDELAKLKIMTMIINESVRLYPPISGFERKVAREVRLGKLILPANLQLTISNLVLHHDPLLWGEDVNIFKPERFSDGVSRATNNNAAAFFPFGMGPRACVGMNFAFNEAKIALSMILQRYSFTLSPSYIHLPFQILSVRPLHGIQIRLYPL